MGSAGSGWCTSSARRTTSVLRARVSSLIPVPRPVTSAGSAPVKTEMRAADAVVFAIPISPVSSALLPAATRSRAVSMPTSMACLASSRVIAGPVVMSDVPARILRGSRPGVAGSSAATPTSTTQTSAPTWVAKALQTAPPPRKLATICAVTSCGQGVTPCACTPWSPHEDRDGRGLRDRRRALPGQTGQLRGDDLQHAERARRLRHALLPLPGLAERLGVQRADTGDGLGEQVVRVLAGQRATAVRLLVDDPRQRAALGPAGLHQLGLVRELVDVADAQVGDHFEVLGQAQRADHLALVEEADPADTEALGAGGEPEVLDRERGGVRRHLRLGVAGRGCGGRRGSGRR